MVKTESVKYRKGSIPYYKIPLKDMTVGRHLHIDLNTGEVLEDIDIKEI